MKLQRALDRSRRAFSLCVALTRERQKSKEEEGKENEKKPPSPRLLPAPVGFLEGNCLVAQVNDLIFPSLIPDDLTFPGNAIACVTASDIAGAVAVGIGSAAAAACASAGAADIGVRIGNRMGIRITATIPIHSCSGVHRPRVTHRSSGSIARNTNTGCSGISPAAISTCRSSRNARSGNSGCIFPAAVPTHRSSSIYPSAVTHRSSKSSPRMANIGCSGIPSAARSTCRSSRNSRAGNSGCNSVPPAAVRTHGSGGIHPVAITRCSSSTHAS